MMAKREGRTEDHSNSFSERETCDVRLETDAGRYASRNMREREAASYLERKEIRDIVDFLLGELLMRRPDDPYEYLIRLLDRRILSRDGLVDSPSPFCSRDTIRRARQGNLATVSELIIENKRGTFEWKNVACENSRFKNMLHK